MGINGGNTEKYIRLVDMEKREQERRHYNRRELFLLQGGEKRKSKKF